MMITIQQLQQLKIPPEVRVVSFDVFDTLLIRTIDPPDEVKTIVAQKLVKKCIIPLSVAEILEVRRKEELKLRIRASAAGFDPECSVEEIYSAMLEQCGLPDSLLPVMLDIELQVEKDLTAPMPGMVEVLKGLSSNCRIVATSDTYLSGNQVEELLVVAGYGGLISKVYASCDYRQGKGSGRLFRVVISVEKLLPEEILHVGDNFHADFLSPTDLGITAFFLFEEWNYCRKELLAVGGRYPSTTYWRAQHFFNRILSLEKSCGASEAFLWGRQVVGPVLTVFTQLLYEKILRGDVRRLYFVARDGYLLKKLFLLFDSHYGSVLHAQIEYLCLSRFTAALASIHDLGSRENGLFRLGCCRLQEVFVRLDLNSSSGAVEIATALSFDTERPMNDKDLSIALEQLFAYPQFRDMVLERADLMREKLSTYLESKGFFQDSKVALIDIGWLGTIQSSIEHAFGDRKDWPKIQGLYLALSSPVNIDAGEKQGLIYDYREANPDDMALSFFREAFEFSTRAFHGSTIGYVSWKNVMVPIFKEGTSERGRERKNDQFILEIQRGVTDFAGCYLKTISTCDTALHEQKDYVTKYYDGQVSFPNSVRIGTFGEVVNTDDFGSAKPRDIVRRFHLYELIFIRTFIWKLLSSPWREAALAGIRVPFLVSAYYLLKRLVCWKAICGQYR